MRQGRLPRRGARARHRGAGRVPSPRGRGHRQGQLRRLRAAPVRRRRRADAAGARGGVRPSRWWRDSWSAPPAPPPEIPAAGPSALESPHVRPVRSRAPLRRRRRCAHRRVARGGGRALAARRSVRQRQVDAAARPRRADRADRRVRDRRRHRSRHAVGRRARPLARTHVGLVPQRLHLVGALVVRDNLRLAHYLAGVPDDVRRARSCSRRSASTIWRAAARASCRRARRSVSRSRARSSTGRPSCSPTSRRRISTTCTPRARWSSCAPRRSRAGRARRRLARRARAPAAAARVRAAAAPSGGRGSADRRVNAFRIALAYARRRPLATVFNVRCSRSAWRRSRS